MSTFLSILTEYTWAKRRYKINVNSDKKLRFASIMHGSSLEPSLVFYIDGVISQWYDRGAGTYKNVLPTNLWQIQYPYSNH